MRRPLVLLIDDDLILRQTLARLSRHCGFAVSEAGNGVEALHLLSHLDPDLIITDLHMPQMSGQELIGRIRDIPRLQEKPLMVVTADVSRTTKISLLEMGADDFICKPVDPEEFQARLHALMRRGNLLIALEGARGERDRALEQLAEQNRELERLTFGLVAALERANSLNDSDTGNHIRRVSSYAAMLAEAYGCEPEFCALVGRYAGLHDVGKVGLRDAILKKPGKLTPEEFEEMKSHTLIGAELLRAAGLSPIAGNVALCHHERWDGGGYPRGLKAEQIPLEARLVSVADVYDALRSKRCYKAAMGWEETRQLMEQMAGSHLDPRLVKLFFAQEEEVQAISALFSDEGAEEAQEVAEAWR